MHIEKGNYYSPNQNYYLYCQILLNDEHTLHLSMDHIFLSFKLLTPNLHHYRAPPLPLPDPARLCHTFPPDPTRSQRVVKKVNRVSPSQKWDLHNEHDHNHRTHVSHTSRALCSCYLDHVLELHAPHPIEWCVSSSQRKHTFVSKNKTIKTPFYYKKSVAFWNVLEHCYFLVWNHWLHTINADGWCILGEGHI